MRLVELDEQKRLLQRFHDREPRLVSGGSVANSVIAFSQLGGQSAFIGCVGDDRYGLFYQTEFEELGIDFGNPPISAANSFIGGVSQIGFYGPPRTYSATASLIQWLLSCARAYESVWAMR